MQTVSLKKHKNSIRKNQTVQFIKNMNILFNVRIFKFFKTNCDDYETSAWVHTKQKGPSRLRTFVATNNPCNFLFIK